MNIRYILLTAFATAAILAPAQKRTTSVLDIKYSITDDAIVYPESFEQDSRKMLEGWYMQNYTASDDNYRSRNDVHVSDAEFTRRLSELPTIIDLPFNQIVRKYIERYTSKSRAQVAAILGLANYYNPIFEQALEAQRMPLELKYLPVIESALNPNAVSRAGASGLWQIMPATAKGLGLEVSSLVDQRRDPYLSSQRAVKYLKDLFEMYNDWSLAIAAYNCGPGTVNKAIRRAGGDPQKQTFWSIYNYLPAETRGYVPMFIAATYVMNYYPKHNISAVLPTKPLVTDTIHLSDRVHFNQIAAILNIPIDEIRILNPQYRADIIPASATNRYSLTLPAQQIQAFLVSQNEILKHEADRYARQITAEPSGEINTSAQTLLADNTETSEPLTRVEESEELNFDDIPAVAQEPVDAMPSRRASTNSQATVRKLSPGQSVTHKVQEGESLATIAGLYGVTPEDIKIANNLRRNSVRVGQPLTIEHTSGKKSTDSRTTAQVENTQQSQQTSAASTRRKRQQSDQQTAQQTTNNIALQPAASTNTTTNTTSRKKTQEQPAAQPQSSSKKKNQQQASAQTPNNSKKKTQQQPQATTQQHSKKKNKKQSQQPATREHTIKQGENLTTIAKKNGVTVEELRKANPQIKGDHIREGRNLNIPQKQNQTTSKKKKNSNSSANKSTTSKKKKKR